jgi:hypothetical protein
VHRYADEDGERRCHGIADVNERAVAEGRSAVLEVRSATGRCRISAGYGERDVVLLGIAGGREKMAAAFGRDR